MISISPY